MITCSTKLPVTKTYIVGKNNCIQEVIMGSDNTVQEIVSTEEQGDDSSSKASKKIQAGESDDEEYGTINSNMQLHNMYNSKGTFVCCIIKCIDNINNKACC